MRSQTAFSRAQGPDAITLGYILYRGAWRLFESSLWFELEDGVLQILSSAAHFASIRPSRRCLHSANYLLLGSDYLTAYAKPGSRPVLGIPLAKASIASPADKGKKPKAGKENKRCKLLIKTESGALPRSISYRNPSARSSLGDAGKEHTLVLNSEEQRDDWMKCALPLPLCLRLNPLTIDLKERSRWRETSHCQAISWSSSGGITVAKSVSVRTASHRRSSHGRLRRRCVGDRRGRRR